MNKDINEHGWQLFLQLCQQLNDQESLNKVFDLMLTAEEKADIALRALIIKNLLAGKLSQREIAKNISVSIAKITRGSNYLKHLDDDFKNLLIKNLSSSSKDDS